MDRLLCKRCSKEVHQGRGDYYFVRIDAVADPEPPVFTEDDLARTLFGPDAVIYDSVVEDGNGGLAGHALWFRTFSTFLGKTGIWLEDLYVRPDHRRQGYASDLLAHLRAQTDGRLEWEVLEWNQPAMDFYQGLGARPMAGWTRYRWYEG